jgi:hypothetical protein
MLEFKKEINDYMHRVIKKQMFASRVIQTLSVLTVILVLINILIQLVGQ